MPTTRNLAVLIFPRVAGPLTAKALPHPRKQLVADPPGILLVTQQPGLQRLVFPAGPQDQQGRRQAGGDERPHRTQAQGGAHTKEDTGDIAGVTHDGVGAGVDIPSTKENRRVQQGMGKDQAR